ncbi:hypothetical protein PDE_04796 [Penicillium oxalicum 114-2]|uniref:Uncharacterized protein n=1 Tax=Penicillium oxalicum (strain 114-2 / CGMCC 5302) TaxID=933388 RepID=S7ZMG5_PENO1|nr:hypothetical protein PDE_04796 [Penicillium oxalicum 114-2]
MGAETQTGDWRDGSFLGFPLQGNGMTVNCFCEDFPRPNPPVVPPRPTESSDTSTSLFTTATQAVLLQIHVKLLPSASLPPPLTPPKTPPVLRDHVKDRQQPRREVKSPAKLRRAASHVRLSFLSFTIRLHPQDLRVFVGNL